MDSYSFTSNTDSSSSASYSFSSNSSSTHFPYFSQQETRSAKPPPPPPAFRSALHSVRRFPAKNVITKKSIAPMPPTPPKIYKVDPVEFKDVVQKLTGAAELQPTRLREVAPPPLSLSPPHRPNFGQNSAMKPLFDAANYSKAEDEEEMKRQKSIDCATFGALSPLGFSLSPSSLAWCTAMLLSPTTLASFEPSVVL